MTKFYEGQEVEVLLVANDIGDNAPWRKAKVVCEYPNRRAYLVAFTNGEDAILDADHIRAAADVLGGPSFGGL